MNKYDRGYSDSVLFFYQNQELSVPLKEALQILKANVIVRITKSEYPENNKGGEILSHIGLPTFEEHEGMVVILGKILRHGSFQNWQVQPPLLSLENVWKARMELCESPIDYDSVNYGTLGKTIGNLKNKQEVEQTILRRYRHSLVGETDSQILSRKISLRKFRLLEKIYFKV